MLVMPPGLFCELSITVFVLKHNTFLCKYLNQVALEDGAATTSQVELSMLKRKGSGCMKKSQVSSE
jgi:hypothetical protein